MLERFVSNVMYFGSVSKINIQKKCVNKKKFNKKKIMNFYGFSCLNSLKTRAARKKLPNVFLE